MYSATACVEAELDNAAASDSFEQVTVALASGFLTSVAADIDSEAEVLIHRAGRHL